MIAAYGSWNSLISAGMVAAGRTPLDQPRLWSEDVYWIEGRPLEGGRSVIMRRDGAGGIEQLTPEGFNVRTRAHEYGGGAYAVHGQTVFFVNDADQQLYRQEVGGSPEAITAEEGARYADMCVSADGERIVCVRERHMEGREAVNEVVMVEVGAPPSPRGRGLTTVIASGRDFYSFPRLSPDGRRLAWTCWDHPNMPWDGTELWVADADGANTRLVAGGAEESIFQPGWSPDEALHWVSDRGGWWQLYREGELLLALEAEFGTPQWVFGMSTYGFLEDGRLGCLWSKDGFDHLGVVDAGGQLHELQLAYTAFSPNLQVSGRRLAFIAGSPAEAAALVLLDVDSGQIEVVRRSVEQQVDAGCVAAARPIEFPTDGGKMAHALFYAPVNQDFEAPAGALPPLLVLSHGGPTSQTKAAFDLSIQFWTSRGFGVIDVNYGGSSGFGREYRQRLNGQWGIVDVADCANAARWLAEQGEVDGRRLAIRGGSAGGYTTLCALTFRDDFAAGASYYGVADCETLATDTHKFESRYLDRLIGPYPAAKQVYFERSPIHFADRLSCPVILFQGLEDRVVPPSQAEAMAQALRRKGLPFAYLAFEGEQHGFRKAETIQRTLEAELYFYSRVFGFNPADRLEPVVIENEGALGG